MKNEIKENAAKKLIEARKKALNRLSTERRIRHVGSVKGINFLLDNFGYDLKGTLKSLRDLEGPIVWIFTNEEIAQYYHDFSSIVADRVKAVIALNRSCDELLHFFRNDVDFFADAKDVKIAVQTSFALARPGDLVLFSPGSYSEELAETWEHLITDFETEVKALED